jgi:hypothetical protein
MQCKSARCSVACLPNKHSSYHGQHFTLLRGVEPRHCHHTETSANPGNKGNFKIYKVYDLAQQTTALGDNIYGMVWYCTY